MTNSFFVNIITRIVAIVLLSIFAGWIFSSQQPIYLGVTALTGVVFLAINLVWYVNKTNRTIAYFFDAVRNDDFSLSIPNYKGSKTLTALSYNLRRISEHIEQIHIENLRQEKYFEAMIEHITVGVMSINSQGFIVNCNSSLKKLLGLNQLTHIRQLDKVDTKLAKLANGIRANQEQTIILSGKNGPVTLLVKASAFKNNNEQLKLLSVQDIKMELDEKELDSWLKLIRVLTHEIMNAIAPITSLSENLRNQYVKEVEPISATEVDEALIGRTIRALGVICEQGQGLTRFVENYRNLTRLPKPEISEVLVKNLFEKTLILFKSKFTEQTISVYTQLENDAQIVRVDESQILQVLLNLLKNSADALADSPNAKITLSSWANSRGEVMLAVSDNGPGIPPEIIDEVFIPFFTTREEGNGIGLSISRQLVRLNNGGLTATSNLGLSTTFTLKFRPSFTFFPENSDLKI